MSAEALPTRNLVNKTPGQPDEPMVQALNREKRWDKDIPAFKRLWKEGVRPRRMEGSAFREQHAETSYDVTDRPVKIDYNDPPK